LKKSALHFLCCFQYPSLEIVKNINNFSIDKSIHKMIDMYTCGAIREKLPAQIVEFNNAPFIKKESIYTIKIGYDNLIVLSILPFK